MEALEQFLPLMLLQSIYAYFAYKIAEKRGKNRFVYAGASLLPGVGALFFFIFLCSAVLYCLDRLKEPGQS